MLNASCHCGAVRIEVSHKPQTLTECSCSIFYRYGARWAHFTRATARVLSSPEEVIAYLWGDKTIEFYHCRHCGCLTHYEFVEKNADSRLSVNARMFSPSEIADLRVLRLDGASTREFLDR